MGELQGIYKPRRSSEHQALHRRTTSTGSTPRQRQRGGHSHPAANKTLMDGGKYNSDDVLTLLGVVDKAFECLKRRRLYKGRFFVDLEFGTRRRFHNKDPICVHFVCVCDKSSFEDWYTLRGQKKPEVLSLWLVCGDINIPGKLERGQKKHNYFRPLRKWVYFFLLKALPKKNLIHMVHTLCLNVPWFATSQENSIFNIYISHSQKGCAENSKATR